MDSSHRQVVQLNTRTLPKATKRALEIFAKQKWLSTKRWYLAGGTALAMHLNHRRSVDLDFFTPQSNFSAGALLKHFNELDWTTDIVQEGTVYGRLLGAKVSFIAYPFFVPKEPMARYGVIRILSPKDIAVMKIIAISQRGRKRDFVDLYWYVTRCEPLIDVIRRLPAQYPAVAHDYHHLLKSLVYFVDAEEDHMPHVVSPLSWEKIKSYFSHEIPLLAKELLHF